MIILDYPSKPKSYDTCPQKIQRRRRREGGNVKTDAETGVMQLYAKEYQRLPEAMRSQERNMKCIHFLEPLERCGPAHTLIQDFWFPELQENKGVLYHLVCGNFFFLPQLQGLPQRRSIKESACHCGIYKRGNFNPWVRNVPWGRK